MTLIPYREPDTIRCPMCAKIGVCVTYTATHAESEPSSPALMLRCGRCDYQIGAMETAPAPDTRIWEHVL